MSTKADCLRGEEGFTLIELLVVVIIIGLLAGIAVPTLMSQRQRAHRAAVQSDLRNAAFSLEEEFSDTGTYAGWVVADTNVSPGVVMVGAAADLTATGYCISATHSSLPAAEVYSLDSGNGSVVQAAC